MVFVNAIFFGMPILQLPSSYNLADCLHTAGDCGKYHGGLLAWSESSATIKLSKLELHGDDYSAGDERCGIVWGC